jgi:hypothetical protein
MPTRVRALSLTCEPTCPLGSKTATCQFFYPLSKELDIVEMRGTVAHASPDDSPVDSWHAGRADSLLHSAGNLWRLIFPFMGVIGGGVRAIAAANEWRA